MNTDGGQNGSRHGQIFRCERRYELRVKRRIDVLSYWYPIQCLPRASRRNCLKERTIGNSDVRGERSPTSENEKDVVIRTDAGRFLHAARKEN